MPFLPICILSRMSETAVFPMLLRKAEVAVILGCCKATVEKLARAGKLKPVPIGTKLLNGSGRRAGRGVRYRRDDVLKLARTGWTW